MSKMTQKKTITPAEFAQYAREHDVEVIYPSTYDPRLKGKAERRFQQERRRDENLVINGVPDFDESALEIARILILRFSGVSFGHLQALTERAVTFIGSRIVVSNDTVVIPELPATGCRPSSEE